MYEERGVSIAADEDIAIHSPRDIPDAVAAWAWFEACR